MDEASRSSLDIVIVTVALDFRVLERDAIVDYARNVPFFTSDSIRPVRPRFVARRGTSQRGLSALRFRRGRAFGSDETTRARAVSFGDAGEKEKNKKKQKNLWRTLRRASRRRRRRTLASSFNLMSRYLSSLSKLSAPTGFGFPSYAWCTRYCTPPIAVMAPTMMAKGGKDSNGCGWFRATTARRSGTARREGAGSARRGEAFRVRAVTRADARVRTKTRDFPRRVVVARSAPRPSRGS